MGWQVPFRLHVVGWTFTASLQRPIFIFRIPMLSFSTPPLTCFLYITKSPVSPLSIYPLTSTIFGCGSQHMRFLLWYMPSHTCIKCHGIIVQIPVHVNHTASRERVLQLVNTLFKCQGDGRLSGPFPNYPTASCGERGRGLPLCEDPPTCPPATAS